MNSYGYGMFAQNNNGMLHFTDPLSNGEGYRLLKLDIIIYKFIFNQKNLNEDCNW